MEQNASSMRIGKKAFISSFVVLFSLVILAGILTRIVPTGNFSRTIVAGQERIDWQSFQYTNAERLPLWRWFTAPIEVLWGEEALKVIVLLLLLLFIGGAFGILEKARILEYLIYKTIARFESRRYLLLAIMVFVFMLFGSVLGVFEEVVPLVPIAISLCLAMGWDPMVGMGASLLATGFGFSAAILNPFTIGLAQKLAGLPPFSGSWYRMIIFATTYLLLTFFLIRYAKKIDSDPKESILYGEIASNQQCPAGPKTPLEQRGINRALLWFYFCLLIMFAAIICGVIFPPIADLVLPIMGITYLIAGLGCGMLYGFPWRKVFLYFGNGVLAIAPSTILILLGVSVKHLIVTGQVMDTLLQTAATNLQNASPYTGIVLIYLLVLGANFFIGSATAKAFLLIPLVIPFADILGLTKQAIITAWAFGDGFSNVIFPTNAVLLIALGISGISYLQWFRWTILLQLAVFCTTIIFLLLAVAFAYGPY